MLAFKEWSIVVDALITGRQKIILRKGGIAEDFDKFEIKTNEFYLFPTLFHQLNEKIKQDWLLNSPNNNYYPSPNEVIITHKAKVLSSKLIEDLSELEKMKDQHVYTDDVITERFERWNNVGLHLINIEIQKLTKPFTLQVTGDMLGCKSWINIVDQH